jgi:hypothetical protein
MEVVAAFAPNGRPSMTSPSWSSYLANATEALKNGSPSIGNRLTDPSAYQSVTNAVTPLEMFYTDFSSWRGLADPNPAFGSLASAFQSETGNNIQFGLRVVSDASVTFSLRDISWALDSNDQTNWFDQSGDYAQLNYSASHVGINYGADGIPETLDDLIYDAGQAGDLPIHELLDVGVGEGFFAATGDGVNNQESIATNLRDLLDFSADTSFELSAEYSLPNPAGGAPMTASGSVEIRIPAGMGGDLNFDKGITAADNDLMTRAIVAGTNDVLFDLNVDDLVNFADLKIMVHDIAKTYFGDANGDREFNSTDLIKILQAGLYETGQPATWSTGDFDANGIFESTDLIVALTDGGYELTPTALAAVPEPAAAIPALIGLAWLALTYRCKSG